MILYPASHLVSPHTFHRLNVFLMRLTVRLVSQKTSFDTEHPLYIQSFPILLAITLYERYFAEGRKFRESSTSVGRSVVARLPRMLKYSAIYEAVMGGQSTDLLEAIFDVEDVDVNGIVTPGHGREDRLHLRSFPSRDPMNPHALPEADEADDDHTVSEPTSPAAHAPRPRGGIDPGLRPTSQVSLIHGGDRGRSSSRPRTPQRTPHLITTDLPPESTGGSIGSPISRLFFGRRPMTSAASANTANATAIAAQIAAQSAESVVHRTENVAAKMEEVVNGIKGLQVHRLKDEMKELQERQARIESLLLVLTRGMRADTTVTSSGSVRR